MEEKFLAAWAQACSDAAALGVRMRPFNRDTAMGLAHRCLSSGRISDGFSELQAKGRLDLSLEALAVRREFTGLFTDEEANTALDRLLFAGYTFQ